MAKNNDLKPDETVMVSQENSINPSETTEVAMLTEYDLRKNLREAISDKIGKEKWDFYIVYNFPTDGVCWIQMWDAQSELDIIMFTYTVENDVITMSEPTPAKLTVSVAQINDTVANYIAKEQELSESLVQANATIQTLTTEISTLKPFKEKLEQAEREKVEAEQTAKREELKSYALSSKLISEVELLENSDIKGYIEQLDKAKINAIIAERFMQKQIAESTKNIETSTDNKKTITEKKPEVVKASLEDDGGIIPDHKKFMSSFLNRK